MGKINYGHARTRGWTPWDLMIQEYRARLILATLRKHRWHRTRTAEALGLHPTSIRRYVRIFGLTVPPSRRSNWNIYRGGARKAS